MLLPTPQGLIDDQSLNETELCTRIGWSPVDPVPHPLQIDVLQSFGRGDRHLIMAGRQIGKTQLVAYLALRELLRKNKHVWVVAPQYDHTTRIWNYLTKWITKAFPKIISMNKTLMLMESVTGSVLECKSAEGGRLVGQSLTGMILDEAALMDQETWEDLQPGLDIHHAWCVMISTPWGKNWFYQEWLKGGMDPRVFDAVMKNPHLPYAEILSYRGAPKEVGYMSYYAPSYCSPYYDPVKLERNARTMAAMTFQQNHLAIPHDAAGMVFPNWRACLEVCATEPVPHHTYGIGLDLAKQEDFTVAVVIDLTTAEVVELYRVNHMDYLDQKDHLLTLAKKWTTDTEPEVLMDATSNHMMLEQLKRDGLRVKAFTMRYQSKLHKPTKQNLIEKLQLAIDRKRIRYPDHPVLTRELDVYGYEATSEGNIKYNAPKGEHDDCVVSLALANWLLGPVNRIIDPIPLQPLTRADEYLRNKIDSYKNPDEIPFESLEDF